MNRQITLWRRWRRACTGWPRLGAACFWGQPYGGWFCFEVRDRRGSLIARYPGDPLCFMRAVMKAREGKGRSVDLVNFHCEMGTRYEAERQRLMVH